MRTGEVEVKNNDTGDQVNVKEGEGIEIGEGKKIGKPKRYSWTKNLNWNMDETAGDVIDKTSLDAVYNDLLDQDYD